MTDITVLADNEVVDPSPAGLRGEWGFAAAVGDVLFDAGTHCTGATAKRILAERVPAAFERVGVGSTVSI